MGDLEEKVTYRYRTYRFHPEPRTYLACLLCMILILGTAVPGANADEKDRCEGTKKQRRQKMELRQIGDEQFAAMLDE